MAQDEQTHRHAIEAKVTEGNVAAQQRHYGLAELQAATQREVAMYQAKTVRWSDFFGQVLGFAVCVGCSYGAFLLGMAGQTGPAIALGAIPTAAIVQSFRTMWNRKSNDKKS